MRGILGFLFVAIVAAAVFLSGGSASGSMWLLTATPSAILPPTWTPTPTYNASLSPTAIPPFTPTPTPSPWFIPPVPSATSVGTVEVNFSPAIPAFMYTPDELDAAAAGMYARLVAAGAGDVVVTPKDDNTILVSFVDPGGLADILEAVRFPGQVEIIDVSSASQDAINAMLQSSVQTTAGIRRAETRTAIIAANNPDWLLTATPTPIAGQTQPGGDAPFTSLLGNDAIIGAQLDTVGGNVWVVTFHLTEAARASVDDWADRGITRAGVVLDGVFLTEISLAQLAEDGTFFAYQPAAPLRVDQARWLAILGTQDPLPFHLIMNDLRLY